MTDRPNNCRNALRDAGKPYPKSGCAVCKDGGMRGCPYEKPATSDNRSDQEALAAEMNRFPDEFNGDDAKLVSCIEALLSLDAKNALVPHGIGGHARGLLSSAMHRLAARLQPARVPEGWRFETSDGEYIYVTGPGVRDSVNSKLAKALGMPWVYDLCATLAAAPAPEAEMLNGMTEADGIKYVCHGDLIANTATNTYECKPRSKP
jgi:hypothetical protein